jgi:hypothetical protein
MQHLFMVMLGAKPKGRLTEQHDIFFGVADSLSGLMDDFNQFWPEAKGIMHIDAWRQVNSVDGYAVKVIPRNEAVDQDSEGHPKLFFINLGGYKPNEFEEYHYKMVMACTNKAEAINRSKSSAFFKHTGFKGANAHVDDKYGIDVDDIYAIDDILPDAIKKKFALRLEPSNGLSDDPLHIGYVKFSSL